MQYIRSIQCGECGQSQSVDVWGDKEVKALIAENEGYKSDRTELERQIGSLTRKISFLKTQLTVIKDLASSGDGTRHELEIAHLTEETLAKCPTCETFGACATHGFSFGDKK